MINSAIFMFNRFKFKIMDALTDILNSMRMRGGVFFRCEFSAPWGMDIGQTPVAEFHVIVRGHCWLKMAGEAEPIHLQGGDLLVFPHGHAHELLDSPSTISSTAQEIVGSKKIEHYGPVIFGKGGTPATVLCGYFQFDDHTQHPLLDALPAYIHIHGTDVTEFSWLQSTINFIGYETRSERPGNEAVVNRLVEVLFIQIIRAYTAQSATQTGILGAIADSKIGLAINAMHQHSEQTWTVAKLAKVAGMSRSAFAMRFHELAGQTPIQYLTFWRMSKAKEMLCSYATNMAVIAELTGYKSEAAFSKAFKKSSGYSPGAFRRRKLL
jgi:AraC-like DNA-binding protein